MPPDKKPEKAKGGSNDRKALEQVIFLLVGLFFLAALIAGILNYIESLGLGTADSIWERVLDYFLKHRICFDIIPNRSFLVRIHTLILNICQHNNRS